MYHRHFFFLVVVLWSYSKTWFLSNDWWLTKILMTSNLESEKRLYDAGWELSQHMARKTIKLNRNTAWEFWREQMTQVTKFAYIAIAQSLSHTHTHTLSLWCDFFWLLNLVSRVTLTLSRNPYSLYNEPVSRSHACSQSKWKIQIQSTRLFFQLVNLYPTIKFSLIL